MASSYSSNLSGCLSWRLPKPFSITSTTLFASSCNSGVSLHKRTVSHSTRLNAKFDKFQGQEDVAEASSPDPLQLTIQQDQQQQVDEEEGEDDSCLPSDLGVAVRQSGEASATFFSSGGMRAILQFLDDEGAQFELWELSRIFLDTLIKETGCQKVKAIFPDTRAAVLLKYQWKDAALGFSSLGDRKPVESDDEIVAVVVPDYQMLEYVGKIASSLSDDPPKALIMWNPRLNSEDVGVGINVCSTFTVVYWMRPLPSGAVFRCYPGLWKVFYDDKDRPNRCLLAKEQISGPTTKELEIIYGGVEEKPEKDTSLVDRAASLLSSLNRFMKVISR